MPALERRKDNICHGISDHASVRVCCVCQGICLLVSARDYAAESASAAAGKAPVVADTVYRNGFAYTADAIRARAEAFAIKDGKFIAVGWNDDMKVAASVGAQNYTCYDRELSQ